MFRRIRERLRRRAGASQDSSNDPGRAATRRATFARRRLRYPKHSMTLRSHDRVAESSPAPAPTEPAEAPSSSESSELSVLPSSPSEPSEAADLGGLAETAITTEAAETTDTTESVEMSPSTSASGHPPPSSIDEERASTAMEEDSASVDNERELSDSGPVPSQAGSIRSIPEPDPEFLRRVWESRAEPLGGVFIYEDPSNVPTPEANTPETLPDIDEDKENVPPGSNDSSSEEQEDENANIDWARARLGPLDAFGMPFDTGAALAGPAPRRGRPRRVLGALDPVNPIPRNGDRVGTTIARLREDDQESEPDQWTERVFADMDNALEFGDDNEWSSGDEMPNPRRRLF